jgi:hypothetical protein
VVLGGSLHWTAILQGFSAALRLKNKSA